MEILKDKTKKSIPFSSIQTEKNLLQMQQYNGNNVSMTQLFGDESYNDDDNESYESDYTELKVNNKILSYVEQSEIFLNIQYNLIHSNDKKI